MKRGFSLVEVCLAMMIMGTGVLSMISLYSFGFRENRQSNEDVAEAAFADAVLNPLVAALSSTNITWTSWKNISLSPVESSRGGESYMKPSGGWSAYIRSVRDEGDNENSNEDDEYIAVVNGDPTGTASDAYNAIKNAIKGDLSGGNIENGLNGLLTPPGSGEFAWAMVISKDHKDSPVLSIALRVVRKARIQMLMSQPLYYTEVHFQGDPLK
jgi:hypothetical protein